MMKLQTQTACDRQVSLKILCTSISLAIKRGEDFVESSLFTLHGFHLFSLKEASFLILLTFLVEHKNCFSLKCSFRKVTVSKHNIRAIIKQYLPFSGTWWRFIDITSAFLGSNFIFIWYVNTKSRLILDLRGFDFRKFSWWNQLETLSVIPQSVASLALLNSWFPIKRVLNTKQTYFRQVLMS